jgi:ribosomal protein S18 acetylase RimI-like enzyme
MAAWLNHEIDVASASKDLVICLLDCERHDRNAFDCGEPALNDYLKKTARQHLHKGIANTYVLIDKAEPKRILGFFTLSFHEVDISQLPSGYRKKLPQKHLPAAKLGRLAIDKSCQGNDYGRLLLVDSMRRVADAIRRVAGVVGLFVDATNPNAAGFYRKFGFISLEDAPLSLMLPYQTILAAFPEEKSESQSDETEGT